MSTRGYSSVHSSLLISETDYNEHEARKVLRKKFLPYVRAWVFKRRSIIHRKKIYRIRAAVAGYLTRRNMNYLRDTNLNLIADQRIYIPREHRVVFNTMVDASHLLSSNEKQIIKSSVETSSEYKLL